MATAPQTGILAPLIPQANPTAAATMPQQQTPTAATYTPESAVGSEVTVDKNQTVAGQLNNILTQGSPLLTQAETTAKQQANSRGLLNSAMAVGAGQQAVINTAMPIAQADANTYKEASTYNANVKNSVSQFNAGSSNTAKSAGAAAQNSMIGATQQINAQAQAKNVDAANALQTQQLDNQNKIALTKLDTDTKMKLAEIESTYKNQLSASTSAAQMYNQTAQNIANIQMNKDLDAGSKQSLIDQQMAILNGAFTLQENISGLDLGKILIPGGSAPGSPAAPPRAPSLYDMSFAIPPVNYV